MRVVLMMKARTEYPITDYCLFSYKVTPKLDGSGFLLFVMSMVLHFPGLNLIPQVVDQLNMMLRSV